MTGQVSELVYLGHTSPKREGNLLFHVYRKSQITIVQAFGTLWEEEGNNTHVEVTCLQLEC